jgi:hypothetical protein
MDLGPAFSFAHAEPFPDGKLHGELDVGGRQKLENGRLAERTVEADLDRNMAGSFSNVADQEAKPTDRTPRVVDSARSVHDIEQLPLLCEMSGQRIVRRIFGMMWVEAMLGSLDGAARPDDRAVEIDRHSTE